MCVRPYLKKLLALFPLLGILIGFTCDYAQRHAVTVFVQMSYLSMNDFIIKW